MMLLVISGDDTEVSAEGADNNSSNSDSLPSELPLQLKVCNIACTI